MVTVGTGLYCTKVIPTKNDDTQSGAPAGQVITLTTAGLGTADAFKGGYVINVTKTETISIVSHTDDTITLTTGADLINWTDGDDLDIYDAWNTITGSHDQLNVDQGVATFTEPQIIRVFEGDYDEQILIYSTYDFKPTFGNYFKLEVGGDSGNVTWVDSANSSHYVYYIGNTTNFGARWIIDGKNRLRIGSATRSYRIFAAAGRGYFWIYNTTFWIGTKAGVYGGSLDRFINCTFERKGEGAAGNAEMITNWGFPKFYGCVFDGHSETLSVTERCFLTYNNGRVILRSCIIKNFNTTALYAGWDTDIRNCVFYNCGTIFYSHQNRLTVLNNIFHTVSRVFYTNEANHDLRFENNCYYNTTVDFAYIQGASYTFSEWQKYVDFFEVSPDANSIEIDPLFTNPAAGDFTLQDASQCHANAIPVGVEKDVTGTKFRIPRCAIGAHRGNRMREY